MNTQKIVILGAGFAALTAIRQLRKKGFKGAINVVAPQAEFHYLPSIIWIPADKKAAKDLKIPLAAFFKRMQVNHIQAQVTGLSDDGRVVQTSDGDISNDGLIIASGGRFLKKLPGIESVITPCEGIAAAEKIRDRLKQLDSGTIAVGFASNPKEMSAVRGGPMFEFLFAIDQQLKQEKRRNKFKLVFFCPSPRPGNRLGELAVDRLLAEMKRRNIEIHIGHKMRGFTENQVQTEGGDFNADLILFMPGMTGPQWLPQTPLPLSPGGMIKADERAKVTGFEKVYVAGDSGSYPGPEWMPKQAHMADLQAEAAASNLLAEFKGASASETFKIELVCIIDSLNKGMLVFRNEKRMLMLPPLRIFHWAKLLFERLYLAKYR